MSSKELIKTKDGCLTSINSTSMLDFFPGLEDWMFTELYDAMGNELIYKIASKFIENPYEYRKGWPDLTMWKDGCLLFVEVKGPRDQLRKSQLKTISEIILPIYSNVEIVSVSEEGT